MCFTFDNVFRKIIHNPRKILGPWVSSGQTVLDVGPGIGYFTIPLARMVGEEGWVIAADVQPDMLAGIAKRAARKGLSGRVRTHLCAPDRVGVEGPVDFILSFWMLHEVRDQGRLLRELRNILQPEGRMLIVEPRLHVTEGKFEASLAAAAEAGFSLVERPRVSLSRAAVFKPAVQSVSRPAGGGAAGDKA